MNASIKDILISVLKKNIENELMQEYEKLNLTMDKDIFIEFIRERINIYSKQINLHNNHTTNYNFYNYDKYNISRNKFKNKNNRCMARIWLNGYGGQCSHKKCSHKKCSHAKADDNDLCNKHIDMLEKYETLLFNRVDEEKPINDKLKGHVLPWK